MRIAQHPGKRLIAEAAAKVPTSPGRLGRMPPSPFTPHLPWERGWGALWFDQGLVPQGGVAWMVRFSGILAPRGAPDKAWLFAGRHVWLLHPVLKTPLLQDCELTCAEELHAAAGPLSAAAGQVLLLFETAGTDPAIAPPTVRNP